MWESQDDRLITFLEIFHRCHNMVLTAETHRVTPSTRRCSMLFLNGVILIVNACGDALLASKLATAAAAARARALHQLLQR